MSTLFPSALCFSLCASLIGQAFAQVVPPPPVDFDPARLPAEMQLTAVGGAVMRAGGGDARAATGDALALPIPAPMPAPGEIVAESVDEATGVWSAWLSNGVRVHVRTTQVPAGVPARDAQVTLRLVMLGGELLEDGASRGNTAAAGAMLGRPSPAGFRGAEAERALSERKIAWRAGSDRDFLYVQAASPRKYLAWTLQFAHLAITTPDIREREFGAWQRELFTSAQVRDRATWTSVFELANAAVLGDDVRWQPLSLAHIEAMNPQATQAWLQAASAQWPIEVAIVGPVTPEQVRSDLQRSLASLPERERVSMRTWESQRRVSQPALPFALTREAVVSVPRASIVLAAPAPDEQQFRSVQALQLAAEMLEGRLRSLIPREPSQQRTSPLLSCVVTMAPGSALPGAGLFSIAMQSRDAELEPALALASPVIADFAQHGPRQDELASAAKRLSDDLRTRWQGQEVWAQALSTSTYTGLDLAAFASLPEAISTYTVDEVREAFASVWRQPAPVRFELLPAQGQRPGVLRRMGE
jgi:predicted Zn-dependent peptidase